MVAHYPRSEDSADAAFAYAWVNLEGEGLFPPKEETFEVLVTREILPALISPDWSLLGYDIVSSYFISALAGYDHSDSKIEFVKEMRQRINSLGLISKELSVGDIADTVKRVDQEINEDPFFAVAVFLLWDNSGLVAQTIGLSG